jgi:hypothetical protein
VRIQTPDCRFPRLTLMIGLFLAIIMPLSSCTVAVPALLSTPTSEPAATPLTPTQGPAAANIAASTPSINNLMFATHQDLSDAHPTDFTFDAGPDAIYLSFNYANVPTDANFQIQLLRGNSVVFKKDLQWTGVSAGSLVQLISDDPRVLIPSRYVVNIILAQATSKGFFNISETSGVPGARLLADNFQNNLAGWGLTADAQGLAEIGNGLLLLSTKTKRGAAYAAPPFEVRDFDLSVDMQFVSGPPRAESTIDFRTNGGGGYWFTIYANGFFEVDSVNGEFKPLITYSSLRLSNLLVK